MSYGFWIWCVFVYAALVAIRTEQLDERIKKLEDRQ
jgi:hypothetical protein